MKTFWKTMATVALAVFATTAVTFAQPGEGRRGDPARMVERQVTEMKDRLKLTDDQAAKVKDIVTDSMKQMAETREKFAPTPGERPSEEMMAAMRKNREETNKKLSEVLSKEQMSEYEKMMSERRGRMGGGRGKKQ